MSGTFSYVVHVEFDDPAVLREWLDWMGTEHLGEVIAAGALAAEVVAIDPPPGSPAGLHACEARYRFAHREAFARYERDAAPGLRAKGLASFPPERGIRYRRSTGEVRLEAGG